MSEDRVSPHGDPLERMLHDAAPTSFAPGFNDRVRARLSDERAQALPHALERHFLRIVPLVAAASLLLAAYNWWSARDATSSALDAALNLPSVSVPSAYASALLFESTVVETGTP